MATTPRPEPARRGTDPAAGPATLVRARFVVLDADRVLADAGLLVRAGRVERVVERGESATADAVVDLEDAALTAGIVDAHAHLELTDLAGRVPAGADFPAWIEALLAQRRAGPDPVADGRAVARGLELLARSGCVAVGDVAGPWCSDAQARAAVPFERAPRLVVHREVLDAGDPARGEDAVRAAAAHLDADGPFARGVSPHAPYTVLDATLERVGALVRARAARTVPLQVHYAETAEEERWLDGRGGPFERLLGPGAGRAPTLDRLERAGLLGPGTVLVHGNHPRAGDPERIAAAGAALVHCPGAHRFFGRAPFPFERYRRAGVRLCLGTDSAAGNDALDAARELALLAESDPDAGAAELWRVATEHGASALGLAEEVGRLDAGRPFTAAAFGLRARDVRGVLDELVREAPPLLASWVEGRAVAGVAARDA